MNATRTIFTRAALAAAPDTLKVSVRARGAY
jgi:hypothetical protein